jgi:hypothetical protein
VVQKEPGDSGIRLGSKEEGQALAFWCEHALIHDQDVSGRNDRNMKVQLIIIS